MPWGLAMTAYGYAVVMPLYGIFHILVSSTALATTSNSIHVVKQIQILDYPSLYTLPNAILLGYGLPVLFMALPVFSTNLHQLFVAGWHLFPIWVSLSQFLLTSINNYALTITMLKVDMTETQSKELDLDRMHRTAREMSLRRAYRFAYMTSASTHVFTLFVIALAKLFPSFLTSSTDQSVSWSGVFLPDYWRSMAAMKSFVQGTLNLLQYDQYAGSLGAITWGIGLYSLSVGQHLSITGWINLVTDVLATSVAFGPAAALTLLMSRRDQEINGLVPPDLRHNISKTDPSNRMETSRH